MMLKRFLLLSLFICNSAFALDSVRWQELEPGEYLVTFGKILSGSCNHSWELVLTKRHDYNVTADAIEEIFVSGTGIVSDEAVATADCQQNPVLSKATLYLDLQDGAFVEGIDGLSILAIEKITAFNPELPIMLRHGPYQPGRYIFSLQGTAPCQNLEINLDKEVLARGAQTIYQLSYNGVVLNDITDPLAPCVPGPHTFAKAFVEFSNESIVRLSGVHRLRIVSVTTIGTTVPVALVERE